MLELLRTHQDLSAVPAEDGESGVQCWPHSVAPPCFRGGWHGLSGRVSSFPSGTDAAYISLPRSSLAVNKNQS